MDFEDQPQIHAPLRSFRSGGQMDSVGVDIPVPCPTTGACHCSILMPMACFRMWPQVYAEPDQSPSSTAERLEEETSRCFGAPEGHLCLLHFSYIPLHLLHRSKLLHSKVCTLLNKYQLLNILLHLTVNTKIIPPPNYSN